jgi:hypothetical protein
MHWSSKLLGVVALAACQTPEPDPPPPVSPTELPRAAPQAVGALAAGTEGAPRPEPSALKPPDRGDFPPYPDAPPPGPQGGGPGGGAESPAPVPPNSVEL